MRALVEQDSWVARLQGEDRDEAVSELRSLLVRGLSRSLANRGGGESFAEDIAQEALLKILGSLDSFEGRSKFTTWALTIATRLAISELRRRRYQDVSLEQVAGNEALQVPVVGDDATTREQDDERQHALKELSRLIDENLSQKQRVAMQAVLAGMPIEQIAAQTGSNRNAVYKLVHDARKRLREGFEAAGFHSEEIGQMFVS